MKNKKNIGSVLVVGGGIGGMQASLDLADSGFKVFLLDSLPSIGGAMAQLDKTFPTNDCAMCTMSPKLVASGRHINIELLTNCEIEEVSGAAGNFEITVRRKTRYIDIEKCTGCGVCAEGCPVDALDKFNLDLSDKRAVYVEYPQAIPLAFAIDKDKCIGCGLCQNRCIADAIKYDDKEEYENLNVGAIVLSSGFDLFDPTIKHTLGFSKYMNVISSMQLERILSASGPYKGHVFRPSDGKIPKKIAFIQCVGSRDVSPDVKSPYCSAVCCMHAIKESMIAIEHVKGLEPTIFYMDIRAYGKDFDKYYQRAIDQYNVKFIRSKVSLIEEVKDSCDLMVHYVHQDGTLDTTVFDMVVLSVGFKPNKDVIEFADKLDIRLNEYDFILNKGFSTIQTTREGVFVCGPAVAPKDIPETVMQASGAVSGAAELLSDVRGTEVVKKEFPEEIDAAGKKPRIGVFVCHCGINIGSIVDVPEVVEYAKTLPNVVYSEHNLFTCSQDTQQKMKELIKEYKLNRVVVSSCSPSTHEPLFQETLREAGLNPFYFDLANIRNHCSWVHRDDKEGATEKAKTLTRIAVGRARLLEPLYSVSLDVTQKALVIGGGLSGMTAALSIVKQGFEVGLIEREDKLGGNLHRLDETLEGKKISYYLTELKDEIDDDPKIKVFVNSELKEIDGYIGNYKTTVLNKNNNEEIIFEHGVILITTGARESVPDEYFFGQSKNVMTHLDFEKDFAENKKVYSKLKNVVMIQCVGSRDERRPYCSRVCCTQSIKSAIKLKKLNPKINVYILYRDIRTYGFYEKFYLKARELGVIFIKYETEDKPVVEIDSKRMVLDEKGLKITIRDHILGKELELYPDKLILASAMVPQDDAEELSRMLKLPLNEDRFFMEAHVKLRPVDFSAEGIFLAGLAHSPKAIEETIAQAKAAAERACSIISSDVYLSEATIANVDLDVCAGCGMCVSVCPYGAPELVAISGKEKASINSALCKGCGSCASVCPSGAMQQLGFKEEQTLAMLTEALEVW